MFSTPLILMEAYVLPATAFKAWVLPFYLCPSHYPQSSNFTVSLGPTGLLCSSLLLLFLCPFMWTKPYYCSFIFFLPSSCL